MKLYALLFLLVVCSQLLAQPKEGDIIFDDPLKGFTHYKSKAEEVLYTKPNEALYYGQLTLSYAQQYGEKEEIAQGYYLLGRVQSQRAAHVAAYEAYRRAEGKFIELGDSDYQAYSHWGLAVIYTMLHQFDSADIEFGRIQQLIGNGKTPQIEAALLLDKGNLDLERGAYSNAIEQLKKTLVIDSLPFNQAYGAIRLGFCFHQLGNLDSAYHYYEIAAEQSKKAKLPRLTARSLNNLGLYEYLKGNFSVSSELFIEGKAQIGLVNGDHTLAVQIKNNLAMAYSKLGLSEKSVEVLESLLAGNHIHYGGRESLKTYDLLLDEYLYQRQDIANTRRIREKRKDYENWLLDHNVDSVGISAAQLVTVDRELSIEEFEAKQKPLERQKLWGWIVAGGGLLLGMGFYFLYFRPRWKKYASVRDQVKAYEKKFQAAKDGLRSGSGLSFFRDDINPS